MIVLWRITESCNLACGFCAYDKRLNTPRTVASADTVAHGLALFADFAAKRGAPVHVSWLGGEPFLWRPLAAVMAPYAGQDRLRFSATTNGTTLHRPDTRQFIRSHLSELTISIDALAGTHDRLRGRAGLWQSVKDNVRALAAERDKQGLKLRANIVLMQSTLPDFAPLCHELADWGLDEITFNALGGRDRPEFFPAERLVATDWPALREQIAALRSDLAARGVQLSGSATYLDRLAASANGRAIAVDACALAETHLFIDAAGRISPCHFTLDDYAIPISSLRSAADISDLPRQFRAARAAAPSPHCADCLSTQMFGKFAA